MKAEPSDEHIARMALMHDNLPRSSLNNIKRYVKKLDERLSVPKLKIPEECIDKLNLTMPTEETKPDSKQMSRNEKLRLTNSNTQTIKKSK